MKQKRQFILLALLASTFLTSLFGGCLPKDVVEKFLNERNQKQTKASQKDANSAQINQSVLVYATFNVGNIYTEIYDRYGLLNNPRINTINTGMYTDIISPTFLPLSPQAQDILNQGEAILKDYHRHIGNLDLYLNPALAPENTMFYCGAGSTQIIDGIFFALGTDGNDYLIVTKEPYYAFPSTLSFFFSNYPTLSFQGFDDPSEIVLKPGQILVEYVTSPNNPTGTFREPETDANIIIGDFVFADASYGDGAGYVPQNIEWVTAARQAGKRVFTFGSASKQFGRPGDRLGYYWSDMNDPLFFSSFLWVLALNDGFSISAFTHFLDLVSAIRALPDSGSALEKRCL